VSDDDRADLDLIASAARDAGAVALRFFRGDPDTWEKQDGTSVTEADIAVDRLLGDRLRQARPDYGWLSEERPDDGSRRTAERVFIVDPIDGTRAFINRTDEWVVSIGIVARGSPVAGVLYNPVHDELWTARAGGGAQCNGAALGVSDVGDLDGARVAASKKAIAEMGLTDVRFIADRRYMKSLAHRLARVADGTVDAALAKSGSADWDLAAAALLVQEAGGSLTDLDGTPLGFNGVRPYHPAFVAAGPRLLGGLLERIGRGRPISKTGRTGARNG
jgi:myo-inositol-1(or 4)-monophosphatase